ncbi:MAG TPA: methylenetetrahydrofolate reductase [Rhizomicrobium sp.]|nr:methylenetetrahydrofolate reductase [Rhizomicrobium sp.]
MSLRQKLDSRDFAITAEVTPPLSCDPKELLARAAPLKGLADAVNVTDGAGARAHLESTVAAHLLLQSGIEPILQLTGRDRNRIALQSQIIGAAALGIENILALTGDDPKAGDQPDAKPVFDLDSSGIVATAAAIRDRHQLPYGRAVGGSANFLIGVADAPIDPPPGWQPNSLRKKIDAGAQFAQTQFCMDADILRRYLARLSEHGIRDNFHLLVGIAPLASARSARWIVNTLKGSIIPDWIIERLDRASDPKAEGEAICVEVLKQMREIPGLAGAHIMAPLNDSAIPRVIERLRR